MVRFWKKPKRRATGEISRRGLFLNPITVWFVPAVVGYLIGLSLTVSVWLYRQSTGQATDADYFIAIVGPVILAVLAVIWVHSVQIRVIPTARMVMLTFLGFRIPVYLTEGNYYLNLRRLLIDGANVVAPPATDAEGYMYARQISFQLWDSGDSQDGNPDVHIKLNSRNGAAVIMTVTLKIQLQRPGRWLSPNDAALLLGDSARKALRHASSMVVDMDINDTPYLLGDLMLGRQIVTARLSDTYRQHREGSLLIDLDGQRHFIVVEPGEDIDHAEQRFEEHIKEHEASFDPDVLKLIQDKKGSYRISVIKVESSMVQTAHDLGVSIDEVLMSDVELSELVQTATNQASAEPHEREAERRTAESAVGAAEMYAQAAKQHGRDAAFIAASATGTSGVQNINVPGLTELAAAIAGKLSSPTKKGDSDG